MNWLYLSPCCKDCISCITRWALLQVELVVWGECCVQDGMVVLLWLKCAVPGHKSICQHLKSEWSHLEHHGKHIIPNIWIFKTDLWLQRPEAWLLLMTGRQSHFSFLKPIDRHNNKNNGSVWKHVSLFVTWCHNVHTGLLSMNWELKNSNDAVMTQEWHKVNCSWFNMQCSSCKCHQAYFVVLVPRAL